MVLKIIEVQGPKGFAILGIDLFETHILTIDIFVLTPMVLKIIEVQGPKGFAILGIDLLHQPLCLEIQACYSERLY